MPDNDFIELGDSNLVPIDNGWFLNKETKDKIDSDGRVFNEAGELIFDPTEDSTPLPYRNDECEWFHKDDND